MRIVIIVGTFAVIIYSIYAIYHLIKAKIDTKVNKFDKDIANLQEQIDELTLKTDHLNNKIRLMELEKEDGVANNITDKKKHKSNTDLR